jgi:hypothetical protein
MKSLMEIMSILSDRLAPKSSRDAWRASAWRNALAAVAKLKSLAPYAVIELVLPGGSLMALALWLYRRQKKVTVFPTHQILSFL